jgi:hypothetical protein
VKGRINQKRMNARSIQPKKEELCEKEADTYLDDGLKTHCVYAATVDAGQIYTDQTGRFSVMASKGNKYIMDMYKYDGNTLIGGSNQKPNSWRAIASFQGHGTKVDFIKTQTKTHET